MAGSHPLKPNEALSQRYQTRSECSVEHYSNTSEDAYGLQGAFAAVADSIDRANDYIFISGWMFEPWIHLPCYGEYLRKALTLHHEGKISEAIAEYNNIIQHNVDNNGYASFFLARALYKNGAREQARVVLETAVKKHSSHRDLSLSLAQMYLEEGALEQAKTQIEFLVAKQDLDALAILAGYYQQKGDDKAAKAVYETIIRLDPLEQVSKARLAYQGLGSIYLRQNDYANAEAQFRKCLWFYPQDIHSLIGLAKTLSLNPETAQESIAQIDICYFEALGYLRNQPNFEESVVFKNTIKDYALWAADNKPIENGEQFESYFDLIMHAISLNPQDPQLFLAKLTFLLKCADISTQTDDLLSECAAYLKQHPGNTKLHQAMITIASKSQNAPQYNEVTLKHRTLINNAEELKRYVDSQPAEVPQVQGKVDLRSFNIMDFDEGMRSYRQTLPSLGETLIRKALANPEMVIAINLWQQHTRPGEVRRYKHPIEELKKIAADLKLPFPENILIRTNHCRDFLNSHHQKYIVMDDGKGDSTAYVGSCDLSGKFEWAEHPIINTIENDNAVDRHYWHNGGESMRYASRNVDLPEGTDIPFKIPRGPWREVMSRVRGPVCLDLLSEFQARWVAKSGGAFSGYKGSDDDEQLVAVVGTTEVRGSLDLGQKVKLKIQEIFNKVKLYMTRSSWNENADKYQQMLARIPGEKLEDKNKHSLMRTPEIQKTLKDLYKSAYQRWILCKKELARLQEKYPENHPRIQEGKKEVHDARVQYESLITRHLQVSPDAQKQILDGEAVDDSALCCTRVISSTQKAYYKSNWKLGCDIDSSIQDAYIQAVQGAEHFIYIENQYFNCDHTKIDSNPLIKAMIDKIIAKAKAGEPFHIFLNLPYSPNGEPGDGLFIDPVRKTQLEIFNYMMRTIEEETQKPWSEFLSINFFAQWNGVDENRVDRLTDKKAISRVESQSISQRAPIYNHSKLLIADGRTIINGSANISDRSLSGTSDTELAIIQTPDPKKPESKRKMELFMLKILKQYYGEEVANAAQARLDNGQDLGLEQAEILEIIQRNTWGNLESFSSNEAGHCAAKDKGFAVAFPYRREFGHPGEIAEEFEFIPDAPRDANGNAPDAFRWVPEQELSPALQFARWTGKTS